jgi:hypothetical protein
MDYNYIPVIRNSIETSVSMKIFKSIKESEFAHIYKSELIKVPLSKFKNVNNFDPIRLQKSAVKAYPLNNRPRGNNDIKSVKYHQKQLQQKKDIQPIWLLQKEGKYILLDGAHRIVASYIEKKSYIYSYLIKLS